MGYEDDEETDEEHEEEERSFKSGHHDKVMTKFRGCLTNPYMMKIVACLDLTLMRLLVGTLHHEPWPKLWML